MNEDILDKGDDSALVDSEDEELQDEFIYVNQETLPMEEDSEEISDKLEVDTTLENMDNDGRIEENDVYQQPSNVDVSEFSDNEENTTSPASQGTLVVRAVYQPSQWTRNPVGLPYVPRFNVRRTGPTRNSNQDSKPLDYFLLFFDDRTWDIMVRETNRYAAQVRSSSSFPHQRPWRDVDHQEMKAFIGLIIAFGIIKLPRIEMHWQRKYPIFGIPAIVMSLVRFDQIWRFFSFG